MRQFLLLFLLSLSLLACTHHAGGGSSSRQSTFAARAAMSYEEQRRYDEYYLESVRQRLAGNYDAAYELLQRALMVNHDASEALFDMSRIYFSFSAFRDSALVARGDSMLERAVALEPSNKFYREALAQRLARKAEFGRAVELYERMVEDDPTSENLSMLVQLCEADGNYEQAIKALDRLETIDGKSEMSSMMKFKIYHDMNDSARAYASIESLCDEYPADLRYRVLLGDLYMQDGDEARAYGIYRDVLAKEPDNAFAQLSMLHYYQANGNDSLYSSLLHEVVLNPRTSADARNEVMRAYSMQALQGKADTLGVLSLFREALHLPQDNVTLGELCAYFITSANLSDDSLEMPMRAILRDFPEYTRARLQLLQLLVRRNDAPKAAELCRDGQLYDPSQVVFYYYEGLCQITMGHDDLAIDAFERGSHRVDDTTDPNIAAELYAGLGDLYHSAGQADDAYAAYESALAYNPDNILCLNNYAYYLSLERRDLDKAEQMSRRTVERESQNATYLDTYAWVLYQKQQYTQARIYIDETIKNLSSEEDNANIYDHAGDIYYRCGERQQAVAFWKKALEETDDAALKTTLRRKIRNQKP